MHFSALRTLFSHLDFLEKKMSDTPLFLVGGSVRDVLVGRDFSPHDIDFTCLGDPTRLSVGLDKSDIHFFQTQKYGTMTLIPKDQEGEKKISYECTPFRSEGVYSDLRHPDEISRSDSLLEDSKRRDFTINCLYFTRVVFPQIAAAGDLDSLASFDSVSFDAKEWRKHDQQGAFYVSQSGVLVLQSHDLIEKCFVDGRINTDYVFSLMKMLSPHVQVQSLGLLLDPYRGLQDMRDKKIKCVGDADKRIEEDALRLLRAVRFAVQLVGFDIEKKTWTSLKKNYYSLQRIAKERVQQEMMKAAETKNLFGFITLLDELNLTKYFFPTLVANKNLVQPIRYHPFDVYSHLLLTLYEVEKLTDSPLLKLAALYHDVGKSEQYYSHTLRISQEEAQKMYGSWVNHVICGGDMTRRDFDALKFSKKEVEEMAWYVEMHMKPGQIVQSQEKHWKKKIRHLYSEAGYERVKNLLLLCIADTRAQYNPLQTSYEQYFLQFLDILEELKKDEGQFVMKDLAINGKDVMEAFDLRPSPAVKSYLEKAFKRVLSDIAGRNEKKKILEYLKS